MKLVQRLCRRILHAIDRRSLAAAGKAESLSHPFDLRHDVATGGYIPGDALSDDLYATDYYGIAPSAFGLALDYLVETGIDPAGFTFVDVGCGKGRALLAASRLPFERLLGVELSGDLCTQASENISRFQSPWAIAGSVEIVHEDAAGFVFPVKPLVLFLYHPFLGATLRRVLGNLERSVARHPREVYLLYANPSYDAILAEFPFLEKLWFYRLPLSDEDAAADRHGLTHETFALYRHGASSGFEPYSAAEAAK